MQRAEEVTKSEWPPVMGGIGVQALPWGESPLTCNRYRPRETRVSFNNRPGGHRPFGEGAFNRVLTEPEKVWITSEAISMLRLQTR